METDQLIKLAQEKQLNGDVVEAEKLLIKAEIIGDRPRFLSNYILGKSKKTLIILITPAY